MARTKLFTLGELKKILDDKQGFIVIFQPEKPTATRTKIHNATCGNLTELFVGRHGVNLDHKLGETNGQKYYHCDFYDEAIIDFPKATPCGICNPKPST